MGIPKEHSQEPARCLGGLALGGKVQNTGEKKCCGCHSLLWHRLLGISSQAQEQ